MTEYSKLPEHAHGRKAQIAPPSTPDNSQGIDIYLNYDTFPDLTPFSESTRATKDGLGETPPLKEVPQEMSSLSTQRSTTTSSANYAITPETELSNSFETNNRPPKKGRERISSQVSKESAAKTDTDHAHTWRIGEPSGPESEGVCKGCGEKKVFKNSIPEADIGAIRRDERIIWDY